MDTEKLGMGLMQPHLLLKRLFYWFYCIFRDPYQQIKTQMSKLKIDILNLIADILTFREDDDSFTLHNYKLN